MRSLHKAARQRPGRFMFGAALLVALVGFIAWPRQRADGDDEASAAATPRTDALRSGAAERIADEPAPMASARTTAALMVYAGFSLAALTWRHAVDASALHDGAPIGGTHAIALPLALSLGALSGVAVVGVTRALVARARWATSLESALREGLAGMPAPELRTLGLAAAVGEELLFRGAMLPAVTDWLGFPAAALATSALFGLLHIPANRALRPWTASAFVMGLLFALLYRLTGEVLAPLTAHAVINLENLELLLRPERGRGAPAGPRPSSATGSTAASPAAGSRPATGG